MQRDLGQGRTGWICLLISLVLTGVFIHLRIAAAEDHHPDVIPEYLIGPDQSSSKYWIGVECREAPPELKSQLGLAEDEGLVVVHLTSDGPAAKAGIKRHDIVVSAGDDKLKRVPDLIKAVNAADGKEMSLKVIRAGKEQTIAVTPAERPKENSQIIARPGPGFMFPGGGPPSELPDNVTVSIVRHGKEPPKITVTRGDEKWEITDKELDKLPEELRPPVEHMLGAGPFPFPMMPGGMPNGFNMPGIRIEGMPNGDFHPGPFGNPPPRDGRPPRDGEHGPPPHDGTPPPRDGDGPPPPAGPQPPHGPGFSGGFQPPMMPGQLPPELMERLDRLDRRLEMLQDDLRRLQDGGPGGIPRVRPHNFGNGPDGPPPRDDQRGGPPRDDYRDGPPGMHGGPPPADHDHRGPPPRDDNDHGPQGGPPHGPPPGDQ
jgi:hypothetical protein